MSYTGLSTIFPDTVPVEPQVACPFSGVHVQNTDDNEDEKVSVTVVLYESLGPVANTSIVYVTFSPGTAEVTLSDLVIWRSVIARTLV